MTVPAPGSSSVQASFGEPLRHIVNGLDYFMHHFRAAGERRGQALVLHGFLDAGGTFSPVAADLAARGFEVFVPDLRGFGKTGHIGKGGYYHFADYVTDVRGLADALHLEQFLLVGHSMGGGIATLFAGTFPERVQKLAVLEGLGPMGELPEHAVLRMRRHQADVARISRSPRPIASEADALARLKLTHPRIDESSLTRQLPHLLTQSPDGVLSWAWDPLHRSAAAYPFYSDAYASFLREISCPTLFVSGGPHGWHPPEESERLALIANLRHTELPTAGHMMHWTEPQALAALLVEFFLSS